jgi:predicted transcriptional regulator
VVEQENHAPVIREVPWIGTYNRGTGGIGNGPFLSSRDLIAVVDAWDQDGDPLELWYVWAVNGELIEREDNPDDYDRGVLGNSFLEKGDKVLLQVTAWDGETSSATRTSERISIVNTPPVVTDTELVPSDPRTTETLSIRYEFSDHDGDPEDGTTYLWLVDNGLGWEISPHHGTTVPATGTEKGQRWKCIIVPSDGDDFGIGVESPTVTIQNTKPRAVISSPVKGIEYISGPEIQFDARGSLDIDGDDLTYLWTIDGSPDEISSIGFSRPLSAGYHVIQLSVSDGMSTSRAEVGVRIVNSPDLIIFSSESYFSNLLPDGTGQVGTDLTYTVFIWNKGDIEATATVKFSVEGTGNEQIGQKEVRVPAQGYDTAFVTWNPDREGFVTFTALVTGVTPEETERGNNIASKNLTVVPRPVPPEPEPDRRAPVVIGTTATIAVIGAAIAGYEPWKYRFFAFLIPLYTKLNHENRMDNENRSKILGFIIGMDEAKRNTYAQPGVSYSTIKKKLSFSNGALAYHLSVLEREGDIRSEKVGKYRLYFPKKTPKPQTMFLERLTDLQERLVLELRKHSEISQKRLVKTMKESQQVISYNLNRLEQKGIVDLKKRGNRSYCRLNPEYLKSGESS